MNHPSVSTAAIQRAAFTGAVGDNAAVAAVAGKKIRVLQVYLHQTGAGSVQFKSDVGGGATALSGVIPTTAENLAVNPGFNPAGHFETAAGKAFNIALGTATAFGWVSYQEIGTDV